MTPHKDHILIAFDSLRRELHKWREVGFFSDVPAPDTEPLHALCDQIPEILEENFGGLSEEDKKHIVDDAKTTLAAFDIFTAGEPVVRANMLMKLSFMGDPLQKKLADLAQVLHDLTKYHQKKPRKVKLSAKEKKFRKLWPKVKEKCSTPSYREYQIHLLEEGLELSLGAVVNYIKNFESLEKNRSR